MFIRSAPNGLGSRTSTAEIVRYSDAFATLLLAEPFVDRFRCLSGTADLSRGYRQQRDPAQHRPEPPPRQMFFRQ
jgi:hypothetical protein